MTWKTWAVPIAAALAFAAGERIVKGWAGIVVGAVAGVAAGIAIGKLGTTGGGSVATPGAGERVEP